MTRRALVLTSEAARHPFRRSLPPHVFIMPKPDAPRAAPKSDDQDWKLFGLSFAAFFTAFYTFIG